MDLTTEDRIIVAVRQITQAVDLWSRELWQTSGLTSPQLAVLREIDSGRNCTPTTLAEALHLTQPTVTGILQRLQRIGAVRRAASEVDRRSIEAFITPVGRKLIVKCPSLLRDRVRARLEKLPRSQLEQLLSHIRLLAEIMGAEDSEDSPFLFTRGSPKGKSTSNTRKSGSVTPKLTEGQSG